MSADCNARKLLRLFANIIEHNEKTQGKLHLDIKQIGAKVPGFDQILPTGQMYFGLSYLPGKGGDNNFGLESLGTCIPEDCLNPDKLTPYPSLEDVLSVLRNCSATEYEAEMTKLFQCSSCSAVKTPEQSQPEKSCLLGVE